MKFIACGVAALLSSTVMAAEPCADNFSVQGNILTGKTYKTWATIAGVSRDDAFQRAYAFTVANGFTVVSSNKEAGAISAAQTVSYGKGKTVPLNVVLQSEGSNLRIDVNYATSGGLIAPEGAIKKHFCATVAAASNGSAASNAEPAQAQASATAPGQPARRATMPGYAIASDAQLAGYSGEIGKNVSNAKLRPLIEEASPAIAEFIGRLACLVDIKGTSAMDAYAAPGVSLHNRYVMMRPMYNMRYHDKGSCLTVSRVQGWKSPANNALQFEVVYKADDSGEIKKLDHEAVRQPDGTWMFTR